MRPSGAGHGAVRDGGGGSSPASPCAQKGGREINPRAPTRSSHLREFRERLTLADEAAERRARRRPDSRTERRGFKLGPRLLGGVAASLGFRGGARGSRQGLYRPRPSSGGARAWIERRQRLPRDAGGGWG